MNKIFAETTILEGRTVKFEGYSDVDKRALNRKDYRRVMCIVSFNSKIVIVKEESGSWNFPGGKMEYGENAAETVIRELDEEADITADKSSIEPIVLMKCSEQINGEWHQLRDQLICYSKVDTLAELTPDPDEDIIERKEVDVEELDKYIHWSSIKWLKSWLNENI